MSQNESLALMGFEQWTPNNVKNPRLYYFRVEIQRGDETQIKFFASAGDKRYESICTVANLENFAVERALNILFEHEKNEKTRDIIKAAKELLYALLKKD